MKLTLALLALALALASCGDNDPVTAREVERETRRALDKGAQLIDRTTDRTTSALHDRFVRFHANQKDVDGLRGERDVRGVDESLATLDRKAKQLEGRFQELQSKASGATDDAKKTLQKEFQQIERELDELQRSLDHVADEIRADLR